MARKLSQLNRIELHKWVIDDLTQAGLSVEEPGAHQALLASREMDSVWYLLRESTERFRHAGPAASLIITINGLLHGPHRTTLMTMKERRKKVSRIDSLCAELAEEIGSLRDESLTLPFQIDLGLDGAMEAAFESWERDILKPIWTEAVLGMTDELERQAGTRGNWILLVAPDANGERNVSAEIIRQSLTSDEAKISEQAVGYVMQQLKEGTEVWLDQSIKSGLEPLLWALQDGVRAWAEEKQIIQKPRDVDEQWAYVIRNVYWFFRKAFNESMPSETAIVVRAIQGGGKSTMVEPSALTSSRVCDIVSARKRKQPA